MGFLAALLGKEALSTLVGSLLGPLELIFRDYLNAKISKEQLQEQMIAAMLSAFTQVETQYLDSITKTYTSFIQATSQNPVMARAWSVVLYSQLGVLIWHQFGIPAFVLFTGVSYPSSGATVDWAYGLVALCLGAPAIASRVGAGASWAANSFSKIIKQ